MAEAHMREFGHGRRTSTLAASPRRQRAEAPILPPLKDTTRVESVNPHIVVSDTRYEGAPCFLYLPADRADTVFVDYHQNLRGIVKWPLWSQPEVPATPPHERAFSIQDAADKGKGMVARRDIQAGELICAERPIYAARRTLTCASDQTDANGIFYRAALQRLSARSKEAFLELASAYPPAQFDIVPGILNTNCLEIRMSDGEPDVEHDPDNDPSADNYAGLFPTLSRVNHSCTPSANYYFSFPTFTGQLYATRTIPAGAEITITYTPLAAPRLERRALLARTRFFVCACDACAVPARQAEASDARRAAVGAILERLEHARFSSGVTLEELEQVRGWAEEEGMAVERAKVLLYGSRVLTICGELSTAMEWAREAWEAFRMVEGANSHNVRRLDGTDRVHGCMVSSQTVYT